MQVKQLTAYKEPGIPTRRILDEYPELLKLLPKRWQTNPAVLTALAGTAVLVSGGWSCAAGRASAPAASKVAPVFQHGYGRAAFGGLGQTRPSVFLDEDDARQVITDEARGAGVNFESDTRVLRRIPIPVTDRYWMFRREPPFDVHPERLRTQSARKKTWAKVQAIRNKTAEGSLGLDGTDRQLNVSFEFVSKADFEKWEARDRPAIASTGYEMEIVNAALGLRHCIAKARPSGSCAVFYDPVETAPPLKERIRGADGEIDRQAEWKQGEAEAAELSRQRLRAQVRDFIKWLKAEGVI